MMINTNYGYNPYGAMDATHLVHNQSSEDADTFIRLFEQAIANGLNPNDAEVQNKIFSQGVLGGYDALMPGDQRRVTRAVEAIYQANLQ